MEIIFPPYFEKISLEGIGEISISKATEKNIDEIADVARASIKRDPEKYAEVCGRLIYGIEQWKNDAAGNMFYLVARQNNKILGVTNGRVIVRKGVILGVSHHTVSFLPGKGIGEAIAPEKMKYFFDGLKVEKVYTAPENKAGEKLAEKQGFEKAKDERHEWDSEPGVMVLTRDRYNQGRVRKK